MTEHKKKIAKRRWKTAGITKCRWATIRKRFINSRINQCQACQLFIRRREITVDHIIPIFKGGKCEPENLQILCVPCQAEKSKAEISNLSFQ
jgi:5-methylcytosine-specific restriction endonuclease McrA